MSNNVNSLLYDRANEVITYFEGKLPAKILEQDIKNNDLEALQAHVAEMEAQIAIQEFNTYDAI